MAGGVHGDALAGRSGCACRPFGAGRRWGAAPGGGVAGSGTGASPASTDASPAGAAATCAGYAARAGHAAHAGASVAAGGTGGLLVGLLLQGFGQFGRNGGGRAAREERDAGLDLHLAPGAAVQVAGVEVVVVFGADIEAGFEGFEGFHPLLGSGPLHVAPGVQGLGEQGGQYGREFDQAGQAGRGRDRDAAGRGGSLPACACSAGLMGAAGARAAAFV